MDLMFAGAKGIACKPIGKIKGGQDGAIYADVLFRFDAAGNARAFEADGTVTLFRLGDLDRIVPHANAVFFGTDFWEAGDEFPLLYINIYNNYSSKEDRKEGTCCAYRLRRTEDSFSAALVQVIKVGFVAQPEWRSEHVQDVRPYGNFVPEPSTGSLYAFVMRDEDKKTRFFRFAMPKATDGTYDTELGCNVVTLGLADCMGWFDTPWMCGMQGAACHDGYIYSSEGFSDSDVYPPVLRLIDLKNREEVMKIHLGELIPNVEPEFVEVYQGKVYYSDAEGDIYQVSFL